MYMQETLHMWYLSSAALVLKACDDLAMGNRTGPTRSHLHRNFRTCRRKKVNVGFWILRQNHIGVKKIEIGVLRARSFGGLQASFHPSLWPYALLYELGLAGAGRRGHLSAARPRT